MAFFDALDKLSSAGQPSHRFEVLVELKNRNEALHAKLHADIYHEVALGQLSEVKISTLLNVNRELYSSNQSLLASLADVLLDSESAADYESIPVSN
jgi:phosphate:Na+ symporter